MATAEHTDIDNLLLPISEESPSGPNLREDYSATAPYQVIKSLREQARAAERAGMYSEAPDDSGQHWSRICQLAPEILGKHAKDLEVATIYIEAMLRRQGFAGLRTALRLTLGLVENFWDTIHPLPDEDGLETRVAHISSIGSGVLDAHIRNQPLTGSDDPGPFSLWDYLRALDVKNTQDEQRKKQKISELGFSDKDIEDSVNTSEPAFFVALRNDLNACIELCSALNTAFRERCDGSEFTPSFNRLRELLEECRGVVNIIARDRFPLESSGTDETPEDASGETAPQTGGTSAAKVTRSGGLTREEALKQMLEIAAFFKKTEPHSPVSYLLEKAVKWGNMSLGELISEIITDRDSRARFSELTGVVCGSEED